jgi:hypothetical protein
LAAAHALLDWPPSHSTRDKVTQCYGIKSRSKQKAKLKMAGTLKWYKLLNLFIQISHSKSYHAIRT